MRLYITRHGQTKWNTEKRMQGFKNSDLTEKGINNAKKLGKALENIEFSRVYSSPLGRTMDTSKYILGDRNIEIVTADYLKEINLGTWGG
ncbi:MAG: histidine phosphatase family protein, partial [Clostridium argentinense]|nr:histidine phosphatase family protein [Clostridium argentinense]